MLVLSRTLGQRIFIAAEIIVTVLGSKNGQVRLGLEAPADIKILRDEIQCYLPGKTFSKSKADQLTISYETKARKMSSGLIIPTKTPERSTTQR